MIKNNIKQLRAQTNMSQERLAQALGVVRTTVNNWERGYSSPDIAMVKKLKAVLQCTYEDLLD